MTVAERTRFDSTRHAAAANDRDAIILIGYAAFAVVLLIAIYLASMSSGTAPGEFVSMTVFP
jgi:hypothetical protein